MKIVKTAAKIVGIAIVAVVAVEAWQRLRVTERATEFILNRVPVGFGAAYDDTPDPALNLPWHVNARQYEAASSEAREKLVPRAPREEGS